MFYVIIEVIIISIVLAAVSALTGIPRRYPQKKFYFIQELIYSAFLTVFLTVFFILHYIPSIITLLVLMFVLMLLSVRITKGIIPANESVK